MNTQSSIETKLAAVTKLLSEVSAELAESRKPPVRLFSMAQPSPITNADRSYLAAGGAHKGVSVRRERAAYYLRIASATDATQDRIWRVVGGAGLAQAHQMEIEARANQLAVERLDSRQFKALIDARLKMIREGVAHSVGATQAEDLKGNIITHQR